MTLINNQTLELNIIPGEYSDPKNLNFTWELMSFSSFYIEVRLNFESPKYISAYEVALYIIFIGKRIPLN